MKEKCNCCNGIDKITTLNEITHNQFFKDDDGIQYSIKYVPPLYGDSKKEYHEEILESVGCYDTGDIVSDINNMDRDFIEYVKHTTDIVKSTLNAISIVVNELNDNIENYKDVKNTRLLSAIEMVEIVER